MAANKSKPPVITLLRVPKTTGPKPPPPQAQSHLLPSLWGVAPPEIPEVLPAVPLEPTPEAIAAQLVPDVPAPEGSGKTKSNVPAAFMRRAPQQETSGGPDVPLAFRNRMAASSVLKAPPENRQVLALATTVSPERQSETGAAEGGANDNFSWDAFLGGSQGVDMWSQPAGAWQGLPGANMWPEVANASLASMGSMWPATAATAALPTAVEEAPVEAAANQSDVSPEQAAAIHEAVVATQQAQYMQQVQFLQQLKKWNQTQSMSAGSRFRDDYRAFRLCRSFATGVCWQGARCVYAHCFEELHPASPDMPKDEEAESSGLAEMKPVKEEKEQAPNMRLRKKRDLCRKFMDTGECMRGSACPNAHGEAEIGKMAFVLYDKVKLTICNHWERGKCGYGDNCIHAHGDHEIGQKRREFFEMPPVKRRKDGETMEEWRNAILRNPSLPSFPM